jgi:hypothetical protein
MCPVEPIKEAYIRPETISIELATKRTLLQVISNPGGTVPPIDPNEG